MEPGTIDQRAVSCCERRDSRDGSDKVGLLTGKQYTDHAGVNIAAWVLSRDGWGRIAEQAGPSAAGMRTSGFGYDPAGRLTSVVDQSGTVCTGRGYGFDTAFNRLTRTTSTATAVSGVCPAGSTVSTTTGAFNTASQLLSTTVTGVGAATGSYKYDGLGRTTTVPAVDTNNPTGENLTLGFFSIDKPATQTLGGTVQSFGLDPVGRTDTTTTTTGSEPTTTASFFDSGSDSPAWSETGGSWTRFTGGPDGALALQLTGTGTDPTSAELMLINPHGDISATIPNTTNVPAAQVSGVNDTDEYGIVETPPGPTPYGWEGAAQRSTADQAGIIQMGARQYNPTTGRFLTLDPVPGGNPNPYTYPTDPINQYDLDGQWAIPIPVVFVVVAVLAAVAMSVVQSHYGYGGYSPFKSFSWTWRWPWSHNTEAHSPKDDHPGGRHSAPGRKSDNFDDEELARFAHQHEVVPMTRSVPRTGRFSLRSREAQEKTRKVAGQRCTPGARSG